MKSFAHAACLLALFLVPLSLQAQTPAPKEGTSPTTPDNARYIIKPELLTHCKERCAAIKGKPCDIIFIGDSITAHFVDASGKEVWARKYAPRNALNFGISADKTQNVLWRMDNLDIKDLKPKVAVILIGTNNTHNTKEEIAAGIKAIVDKTRSFYPGIKVILVSIMPNQRANDLMMSVNGIIKGYADDKTVYYLDLVPVIHPPGDDAWKGFLPDHLHPNATGYQIWADTMEPLLSKLLSQ